MNKDLMGKNDKERVTRSKLALSKNIERFLPSWGGNVKSWLGYV